MVVTQTGHIPFGGHKRLTIHMVVSLEKGDKRGTPKYVNMVVSENRGTPKSSNINHL